MVDPSNDMLLITIARSEKPEAQRLHAPLMSCSGETVCELVTSSTSEGGGVPVSNEEMFDSPHHAPWPLSITEMGFSTRNNREFTMMRTLGDIAKVTRGNCQDLLTIRLNSTNSSLEDISSQPATSGMTHRLHWYFLKKLMLKSPSLLDSLLSNLM